MYAKTSQLVAMVAAGIVAGACSKKTSEAGAGDAPRVFCGGINACAGKSACKTSKNDCAVAQ